MRQRHSNGQLKSLKSRLTPEQMQERAIKRAARQTVAETLNRQMVGIANVVNAHSALFRRGFVGRLKWVVLGR